MKGDDNLSKGILIIGTDTDIGKTFITAGITYLLRKNGFNACSFKPIESGGILKGKNLVSKDTKFVKDITNLKESNDTLNTYCLKTSVSPHLAFEIENKTFKKKVIIDNYKKLDEKFDYKIVEGAGGVIVPIIRNEYFLYDLIKDLDLPVVIVTNASVGTINKTLLTVNFLKEKDIKIKGIIINNYTNKFYEDDNIKVLKNITKLDILAIVKRVKNNDYSKIRSEYESSLDIKKLLSLFT
ncbi:MAG: dethiobiotin synthase [Firmicutes bacterium]|nr:dethiobiotin synthase [Bacillota bacterium]